jgi:hypothetical protein
MTDNKNINSILLLLGRATFACEVDLSFRHALIIVGGAES